jgi:hypothetical protein
MRYRSLDPQLIIQTALSSSFAPTEHSPARIANSGDLLRYRDYCSKMLSIAAIARGSVRTVSKR